ncbi:MAG: hypothetical protein JJE21_04085 [Spirochaetaceae bacterium]|nr:hypothetical protein [Spirochaetaceae bacterium]
MKISIIGDSISTFEGYNPKGYLTKYPFGNVKSVEQTWWKQLIENNNWELVENNSYSGSRVSNTSIIQAPNSNLADDSRLYNYESDIIIIFGGTNDFGAILNQPTLKEFSEKYNYMITTLIEKNPNTILYLCTPLVRHDLQKAQKHQLKLSEVSKTIKKICRAHHECKLIDLYKHRIKISDFFFVDGLHPNAKGMKILSAWIEESIK